MRNFFSFSLAILYLGFISLQEYTVDESRFIIHTVDPSCAKLAFYWKDPSGNIIGSIETLKQYLESHGDTLRFAMNAGMYNKDQSPQGLLIQEGRVVQALDSSTSGYGNFYLQPNGVFYLTISGKAGIVPTPSFIAHPYISYATQSGPMLLIEGIYHPKLVKGSSNLHIRNAVGILPDGAILFAMSKEKVNFFDLATLFKQKGCKNALYLDGFVSQTYHPSADWVQLGGNFGPIIGEKK